MYKLSVLKNGMWLVKAVGNKDDLDVIGKELNMFGVDYKISQCANVK